ncbi:MAG TPA: hypothetical protein VE757_00965, partial [Gaiellaceae bacterium]|nr:hypothetical protein [Gaiellaceae bacterium]
MTKVAVAKTFRLAAVGAFALTFAASAYAYVCHPDLRGTRSLAVQGRVDNYLLSGRLVTLHAWI